MKNPKGFQRVYRSHGESKGDPILRDHKASTRCGQHPLQQDCHQMSNNLQSNLVILILPSLQIGSPTASL